MHPNAIAFPPLKLEHELQARKHPLGVERGSRGLGTWIGSRQAHRGRPTPRTGQRAAAATMVLTLMILLSMLLLYWQSDGWKRAARARRPRTREEEEAMPWLAIQTSTVL